MAEPTPCPAYPTALGASDLRTITLLGHDLAEDVMGSVGFGELAFWLATQRRPAPGETRVFEAVLAALADHGFTPTAIVTRLTYLSAPDSVQGALAAGLLGGGSRFLGVTEDTGRFLHDVLESLDGDLPTDDVGWDASRCARSNCGARPGSSSPDWDTTCTRRATPHPEADPHRPGGGRLRPAPEAVRRHRASTPEGAAPDASLNGAGVCGAALADLGLPSNSCAASRCWPVPPD